MISIGLTDDVTVDGCADLGDIDTGNAAYLISLTAIDNITNPALVLGIGFRDDQICYPIPINISCSNNFSTRSLNREAIATVESGKAEGIIGTS